MRIITNADDFGMDPDTTRATIECLNAGALTSATIMPHMPGTDLAVEYAAAHPEKSFGVHLTYVTDTVEAPLSDPATIPTLVAPSGQFLPSQTLRVNALRGRVAVADIERETAAQIQRLVDRGVRPSHVDSHGHLHKFKPFRRALANVLPRFGITNVRNVQDLYLKKPLKSPTFWLKSWWRRKLMRAFATTTHFYMPPSETGDTTWPAKLLAKLPTAATADPTTSVEVGVHPGHAEPWRQAEHDSILAFATAARAAGHILIGWREL